LLNNSAHFRPEVAVIFRASPFANKAKWLARVTEGDALRLDKIALFLKEGTKAYVEGM
jgi:type II secretory pathway component PulM